MKRKIKCWLDHSILKKKSANGGHKLLRKEDESKEGLIRVAETNTPGWYFKYTKGWKRLHY
jgi:hypothetical protein